MDDHYDGVAPTVCGAYLSCVEVRGGVNHAARDGASHSIAFHWELFTFRCGRWICGSGHGYGFGH